MPDIITANLVPEIAAQKDAVGAALVTLTTNAALTAARADASPGFSVRSHSSSTSMSCSVSNGWQRSTTRASRGSAAMTVSTFSR